MQSPSIQQEKKHISVSPNTRNEFDHLLALRAFACLLVVIAHCKRAEFAPFHISGLNFSWLFHFPGTVGVWIFFCISGYLMGKGFFQKRYMLSKEGVSRFYLNRFLRIAPLYYFSILIFSLFVYPLILKPENWHQLIRLLTFTYNSSPSVKFNPVLWSISTEFQFYLLIPFIFGFFNLFVKNKKQIIIVALSIVGLVASLKAFWWNNCISPHASTMAFPQNFYQFCLPSYAFYIYSPVITNLDCFMAGFLINPLLSQRKDNNKTSYFNKKLLAWLIYLGSIYFITAYIAHYSGTNKFLTVSNIFFSPLLAASLTAALIYVLEKDLNNSTTEELSFKACQKNPLRSLEWLGKLSFGIYIWHFPIIEQSVGLFESLSPAKAFFLRTLMVLSLSTLLSWLTYRFIELPFEIRKKHSSKAF